MLNLILIPNDQGEVWLHVGTGVSRHCALVVGRCPRTSAPPCAGGRVADRHRLSGHTDRPGPRGLWVGSAALRHRAPAGAGTWESCWRGTGGPGSRHVAEPGFCFLTLVLCLLNQLHFMNMFMAFVIMSWVIFCSWLPVTVPLRMSAEKSHAWPWSCPWSCPWPGGRAARLWS